MKRFWHARGGKSSWSITILFMKIVLLVNSNINLRIVSQSYLGWLKPWVQDKNQKHERKKIFLFCVNVRKENRKLKASFVIKILKFFQPKLFPLAVPLSNVLILVNLFKFIPVAIKLEAFNLLIFSHQRILLEGTATFHA